MNEWLLSNTWFSSTYLLINVYNLKFILLHFLLLLTTHFHVLQLDKLPFKNLKKDCKLKYIV